MRRKAFTFLELMLVVTIFVVIAGLAAIYSQTSQVRADVNTQAASFVSYARLSSSNAMAGKNDQSFGIHLDTDSYVLFDGASYTDGALTNFEIELPATVKIQNISLNGGGQDIIFDQPFGYTDEYGSFDIVASQIGKTASINIDQYGKISY